MTELKDKLRAIENKYKMFKQQQFIFIAALERSREHVRNKTRPVTSIAQIQSYMDHHCKNTTDQHIFSLFLDIADDLKRFLEFFEGLNNHRPIESNLTACRGLLSPSCDISQLQAGYPHDEVNRLSCHEARNYYGGAVSLFPLALELLNKAVNNKIAQEWNATHSRTLKSNCRETTPQQLVGGHAKGKSTNGIHNRSNKAVTKQLRGWHAGKPAWRPPGCAKL